MNNMGSGSSEIQTQASKTGDESVPEDVADELLEVEYNTTGKNTVLGEIKTIQSVAEGYEMSIQLPDGEVKTRVFDKPKVWSEEFELVKITKSVGFDSASGIEQLPGTRVELWVGEDGWEFATLLDWKR